MDPTSLVRDWMMLGDVAVGWKRGLEPWEKRTLDWASMMWIRALGMVADGLVVAASMRARRVVMVSVESLGGMVWSLEGVWCR